MEKPMQKRLLFFSSVIALVLISCATSQVDIVNSKPVFGKYHFIHGYDPLLTNDTVQVIIEIPAGTNQKWEVNKSDGNIQWEIKDGKHRIVQYLGYPGNYGMVPRTLLSYVNGGDGDPLDVLVLGPPLERGSVVSAKLIGVLNLSDSGEQDDKLIAVMKDTPFYDLGSVQGMRKKFPGVLPIIETWFESYKGPGEVTSSGYSGALDARVILDNAIETYALKYSKVKIDGAHTE
jgi:inorganic pyrophosphatase